MKKEFILIVLVLLVFSLSGQNVKTDPTLAQIEKCNTNLDKANLLYNIYTDLENDFPDSAITYANQANKIYQILSKSKDDQISQQANKRIAYINHNLGRYHISKGAFDKALVNLSVSLPVFIKNRDSAKIAACYNNYGVVYESMGEYSKAINYYHQSLDIEEGENNTLGIATCYLNIGVVYYYQSDFSKAINYYENALELYETLGEQEYMTFCYVNIGILYDEQSKYELSYDYFQKALAVARKLQDKYVEGYCYSNMGSSYKKQKKYETSIAYYNKSLEVRRTIGDKQGEAVVIDNIANLNLIIAQSIDKPEIAKHHYSIALKYSKEALLMGQNIGLLPLQKTAYLNISEAYKGLKKYKKNAK
ncbi:MAG: hypothetical protein B7C24_09925 [Bacteroidetes bacterium 4572_77]|nr:MAG: hypothetical protein B7C24_09925 [Bacteroidetes bacterium 4572_77]